MKKRVLIFLFTLTILYSNSCISQSEEKTSHKKNVIHGSLGSAGIAFAGHISYDRLIASPDKGFFKAYYATLRTGGGVLAGYVSSLGILTTVVGVTSLTGRKNKHFELGFLLGLGTAERFDDDDDDDDESFFNNTFFLPNISIGYRFQANNGFSFRTGIGLTELVYVGVGFGF